MHRILSITVAGTPAVEYDNSSAERTYAEVEGSTVTILTLNNGTPAHNVTFVNISVMIEWEMDLKGDRIPLGKNPTTYSPYYAEKCSECDGAGFIPDTRTPARLTDPDTMFGKSTRCIHCNGTGIVRKGE